MKLKKNLLFSIICLLIQNADSYAFELPSDIDAGIIQQHNLNIQENQKKEKQLWLEKQKNEAEIDLEDLRYKKNDESDNSEKPKVLIDKINFTQSDILSNEELNEVKARYVNKNLSIDDINNMLIEINNLYTEKKFLTAKAILPAQTIKGGVLNIELIEGRIGKIVLEGNKFTRKSYILDKFTQEPGEIFDLKVLEQDIIYFNNDNDVKLKGKLRAGEEYSKTDIYLRAYEPNPFHFIPTFDNTGRDSIGVLRGGVALVDDSLLGYRDQLTMGTSLARGTTSAYANYGFPLGNKGTTLNGLFSYSHIKIVDGEFKPLNITGNSFVYGINLLHPLVKNKRVKLVGNISFNFKESSTYFDKHRTISTPIRALNTGFNAEINDRYGVWHTGHNFINGLDLLGAKKPFFKYEGNIYRVQRLPKGIIGLFKASTSLSPNKGLPSTEQFQLGGSSSVRGFSEGLLTGNNGYSTGIELILPIPFLPEQFCNIPLKKALKWQIFAEHGGAFPYRATNSSITQYDFLTSAGMGLRINFNDYVSGVFNWGFGMGRREADQPTARFHFSLQANPLQFFNKETL